MFKFVVAKGFQLCEISQTFGATLSEDVKDLYRE